MWLSDGACASRVRPVKGSCVRAIVSVVCGRGCVANLRPTAHAPHTYRVTRLSPINRIQSRLYLPCPFGCTDAAEKNMRKYFGIPFDFLCFAGYPSFVSRNLHTQGSTRMSSTRKVFKVEQKHKTTVYLSVLVDDDTGRRISRSDTFATRQEAKDYAVADEK